MRQILEAIKTSHTSTYWTEKSYNLSRSDRLVAQLCLVIDFKIWQFFFFNENLSHFLRLFGSYFSEFYRLEAFFFKKDQFFLNIIS